MPINPYVRGCLVYPGISIFVNIGLVWLLEFVLLKRMHWLYYHYFLYLAQNQEEDEEFETNVLKKSREKLV